MLAKDWGWRRGLKGFLEAKYSYILKKRKEQAGAELCQAQSSAKLRSQQRSKISYAQSTTKVGPQLSSLMTRQNDLQIKKMVNIFKNLGRKRSLI